MSTFIAYNSAYDVYLGFWTNWSHGSVRGATITLDRRNGGFLIAFLAMYVAVVGKSYWRIACFTIHHMLSSTEQQDGLYHQRQAVLRNSSTATDGLLSFLRGAWAWRKNAHHTYRRMVPMILFASLTATGFGIAGIFSSHVTTSTSNEVLITSKSPGILDAVNNQTAIDTLLNPWVSERMAADSTYASQCYFNSTRSASCQRYVKSQLPVTVVRNASCPFANEMCRTISGNLILDTGFLNSHTDIGLNAPPRERFLIRIVHHCAPLVTAGFSKLHYGSNSSGLWSDYNPNSSISVPYMRYYYGEPTRFTEGYDFTYQYPAIPMFGLDKVSAFTSQLQDYTLGTHWALSNMTPGSEAWNLSSFHPIQQLQRTDAEILLVFLSANSIVFMEETSDLWYSAHRSGPRSWDNGSMTYEKLTYLQDEPASVLGCTMQYQFCNSSDATHCSPLKELTYTDDLYQGLVCDDQQDRVDWSLYSMFNLASVSDVISDLGSSVLASRSRLLKSQQYSLPENQWQLEVQHWFSSYLAGIQRAVVDAATGPGIPELDQLLVRPNSTEKWRVASNQKILSAEHYSFSVLGLLVILIIGFIIIIIDQTLESCVGWVQKRYNRDVYSRLEWATNGTLQLQRLAHEELGFGTWSKATETQPVTQPRDHLAVLDISDIKHPTLKSLVRNRPDAASQAAEARPDDSDLETGKVNSANSGDNFHINAESDDADLTTDAPTVANEVHSTQQNISELPAAAEAQGQTTDNMRQAEHDQEVGEGRPQHVE